MAVYILVCAWLFAFLDWKVIEMTRFTHPEWKEWMHSHEVEYAAVTRTAQGILCLPALALKPVFLDVMISVEAAEEQQEAIRHAPKADRKGFYHLTDRKYSWTFVSWASWFLYWLPPSLLWLMIAKKVRRDS